MAKSHSPKKAEQTTIEWRAVEDVIPYARNPRLVSEAAISKVAGSIAEFGFRQPIVVDGEGIIIVGHTRLLAAQRLGLETVPVLVATDLSPAQVKAYRIADNRTAQETTWDYELLELEVDDLGELDYDLSLTGLDDDELADLHEDGDGGSEIVEDEAPEPPEEPVTKPGDVWLLGEHRVMCGDSTDAGSVTLLMGGGLADFLFTSPPYNVGVAYGEHDDATAIWDDYGAFLSAVVRSWLPSLADGRVVGWNIGSYPKTFPHRQMALLEEAGCTYLRTMVWQKVGVPLPLWHNTRSNPVARNFHPNYTHEWVLLFSKGPLVKGGPVDPDELLEHDVFRIYQSDATRGLPDDPTAGYTGAQSNLSTRGRKVHPAAYPVRLPAMFASCLCDVGAVMADPFLGSGTTLIAAEQLGRICYGMEIDPRYCDVIVNRWEAFTGKKAERVS